MKDKKEFLLFAKHIPSNIFILAIIILLFLNSCCDCGNKVKSDGKEKKIITGSFIWEQWKQQAEWKTYEPIDYAPDGEAFVKFGNKFDEGGWSFLLFAGSWCGDSEVELPRIYKLFEITGISLNIISLYGVDRDKKEPSGLAETYKIEKVPTMIILNNSKEIGRIIEHPKKSWERDLVDIMYDEY